MGTHSPAQLLQYSTHQTEPTDTGVSPGAPRSPCVPPVNPSGVSRKPPTPSQPLFYPVESLTMDGGCGGASWQPCHHLSHELLPSPPGPAPRAGTQHPTQGCKGLEGEKCTQPFSRKKTPRRKYKPPLCTPSLSLALCISHCSQIVSFVINQ